MGCRAENRALVVPQDPEPALDVGSVIRARFGGQGQIGAKKRCAKLGNQFLASVTFIAPLLAPEFTVEAFLVLRSVGQLVGKRGVVRFWAAEALEIRHLHMITAAAIESSVPAVADICAGGGKEFFGMIDPLFAVDDRLGLRIEMLGQAFDLLDVKDAVAFHERDFALFCQSASNCDPLSASKFDPLALSWPGAA